MATNQLRGVLQSLRRATLPLDEVALTDGQLLESYVRSREEAAFAALVQRHGPMVWGVCRRVLGSHHDAEDAFQATFLVLVRRAVSVVPREKVANWLYGVAHQTALYARATAVKRGAREKQVTVMPEPAVEQRDLWDDLQPLLDQELGRLPDKYRAVIVLCELEGKTRKEAARHLELPEGTVASRLATARTMLAKRLARHGLAVSGGALATVLSQQVASASVPITVASATIKAASLFAAGQAAAGSVLSVKAVALTEGVLETMLLTKLKIATAVLLVLTVLGTGAAALTRQVPGERPAARAAKEKGGPSDQPMKDKKEGDKGGVVSGVVKAVDAEKNTLTVNHKEGDKTFPVAQDANVVINGKPGNLAGLPKGALASLTLFAGPMTVRSIEAVGPHLGGVVLAVHAEKRAVTVTVSHGGGEKTFTMTKNANVVIDGKPGKLTGLPTGANVTLSWFVDQQTARNLEALGPWWQSVLVKAVDAEKNTITFADNARETELAGKTFPVAKDAFILIDGNPGKRVFDQLTVLAGLPPGSSVDLSLSADQKTVRSLEARGREFPNVLVKAVDPDKNTITFADDKQPVELAGKTFLMAKGANITIDGKPGSKLAAVPPGASAIVHLSVDQKTVRNIDAQGAGFQNVPVKAVDAEKNTIAFADDKAAAELAGKTFPVAKNARIEVDGKPGSKLAEVPAGAFVNVNLSADQKTVRFLNAGGSQLGGFGGVVVQAVDAEKNTLTVDIAEEGEKTFTLARNATIEIDGEPGKLARVPKEASVSLTLCADQKTVRWLQAKGLQTNGVLVQAVDARKNTITIADDAAPATVAGKTFVVAKDARISIDGKPDRLAGVPPGASIDLWLSVDQKTAIAIGAQGALIGITGGVVVQAVDPEKNTITVDINGEGEKTFTVAKDAYIRIDGKPGKLAQVPKEAGVSLALCADQKTVARMEVKSP